MHYDVVKREDGWWIVSQANHWFGPYPSEQLARMSVVHELSQTPAMEEQP